ncbi:uncharacterized protein LOC144446725 [Glandiceps talaboti]
MESSIDSKEDQRKLIKGLCIAIETGDVETTKLLLGKEGNLINADEDGNVPARSLYRNLLMVAVDAAQVDTAKYLVEQGIDVNHKMWVVGGKKSARDFAKERGLEDVVRYIDERLSPAQRLFLAVSEGDGETLQELIDTDINCNVTVDQYGDPLSGCAGYSLLMIAIKNEQSVTAKMLLSKGADVNFQHQEWDRPDIDSDPILVESVTARQLALQNGMLEVVQVLDSMTPRIEVTNAADEQESNGTTIEEEINGDPKYTDNNNSLENNQQTSRKIENNNKSTPKEKKGDSSCTCTLL